MNSVYLQVRDPMALTGPKLSLGVADPDGPHQAECVGCGQSLSFSAQLLNCTILKVACSRECASHFVWPTQREVVRVEKPDLIEEELPVEVVEEVQEVQRVPKAAVCPVCKGPAKGRGYRHSQVNGAACPESTEAKLAAKKN